MSRPQNYYNYRPATPADSPAARRRLSCRAPVPQPPPSPTQSNEWARADASIASSAYSPAECELFKSTSDFEGYGYYPTPSFPVPDLVVSKPDPEPAFYPTDRGRLALTKTFSTTGSDTQTSSVGSLLSPIQTDASDTIRDRSRSRGPSPLASASVTEDSPKCLVCLGPQCEETFTCEDDLRAHVKSIHTHTCHWAGCDQPSFESRNGLIWHVDVEHLLVCPSTGCKESSFQSSRLLKSHIAVAHPEAGIDVVKDWQLSPTVPESHTSMKRTASPQNFQQSTHVSPRTNAPLKEGDSYSKDLSAITAVKRKCQDQLRKVVEKKAKRSTANTPRSADSPTDLVRGRASRLVETTSFPLVFEHAILPFLAEFIPKWAGSRYVISATRGRTAQSRRICIMTQHRLSRARKMIIATHVQDLLPSNFKPLVSFFYSVGRVDRMTWARGLSKDLLDDICTARNPYFFRSPCMGDSIGITGNETFEDSTATLGPCLFFGGRHYWLGNFHPFLQAYQHAGSVEVEHPSLQDRKRCVAEGHDAMAQEVGFKLGDLQVTSGWNLKTTRISHEPYWEEMDKEQPLVVTDWALIGSRTSHANMLRQFPSETQPPIKKALIRTVSCITPGADVLSSGRTSGYQRGQVCEIPALVSGDENGTQKTTREWFIEEPYPYDDEEAWIRGGIGVHGDSGAAIVEANTHALLGHLWGRNHYYGPGPRHTFFTPIADVFDDIQEKCGEQVRPQLPQHRDDDDRYPIHPTCRQCYDLRVYLDSRRSSRISLQSMIMGRGDGEHDLTSIEADSELATPRDSHRIMSVEEASSSFHGLLSPGQFTGPCPGTPSGSVDIKHPYAPTLDIDDLYDTAITTAEGSRKRSGMSGYTDMVKRQRRAS